MPSSPEIEDKYGVRFLGVDITSAGGMIQVRYQVPDSAKTPAIHVEDSTPHIITADGTHDGLPGMPGHTHIGPVKKAGTTDFVLLGQRPTAASRAVDRHHQDRRPRATQRPRQLTVEAQRSNPP